MTELAQHPEVRAAMTRRRGVAEAEDGSGLASEQSSGAPAFGQVAIDNALRVEIEPNSAQASCTPWLRSMIWGSVAPKGPIAICR